MAVRVLVVEDDAAMRRLLVAVFRRQRYAVASAANGLEALELLAAERFDLLLSDIRMSPMGGLSLATRARALAPSTKILLVTAYGAEEDAQRALSAGADSYLEKPFSLRRLLATVRALLGQDQSAARSSQPPSRERPAS